jgi:hypothetical protein
MTLHLADRTDRDEPGRLIEQAVRGDRRALGVLLVWHRRGLRRTVALRLYRRFQVRVAPSGIHQGGALRGLFEGRTVSDFTADRDPIELLAHSFLARFRRGERQSVEHNAAQHPVLAHEIRELLPAVVMLEHAKPSPGAKAATNRGAAAPAAQSAPRQLGDYLIVREIGRGEMVVEEGTHRSTI